MILLPVDEIRNAGLLQRGKKAFERIQENTFEPALVT
jgi:hypothetical protein